MLLYLQFTRTNNYGFSAEISFHQLFVVSTGNYEVSTEIIVPFLKLQQAIKYRFIFGILKTKPSKQKFRAVKGHKKRKAYIDNVPQEWTANNVQSISMLLRLS